MFKEIKMNLYAQFLRETLNLLHSILMNQTTYNAFKARVSNQSLDFIPLCLEVHKEVSDVFLCKTLSISWSTGGDWDAESKILCFSLCYRGE